MLLSPSPSIMIVEFPFGIQSCVDFVFCEPEFLASLCVCMSHFGASLNISTQHKTIQLTAAVCQYETYNHLKMKSCLDYTLFLFLRYLR